MIPRLVEVFSSFSKSYPNLWELFRETCEYVGREASLDGYVKKFAALSDPSKLNVAERFIRDVKREGVRFFSNGSAPVKSSGDRMSIDLDGEWPPAAEELYYALFLEPTRSFDDFEDTLSMVPEIAERARGWWASYQTLVDQIEVFHKIMSGRSGVSN